MIGIIKVHGKASRFLRFSGTSSKIPQLFELLQQGRFWERAVRQSVQDTAQGHVNLVPFLRFDKAHPVEGLGASCHCLQRLGLGVLHRFSGQLRYNGRRSPVRSQHPSVLSLAVIRMVARMVAKISLAEAVRCFVFLF